MTILNKSNRYCQQSTEKTSARKYHEWQGLVIRKNSRQI